MSCSFPSSFKLFQSTVALHKQLAKAVQIRDQWREKDKETPQEEKARLLKQVRSLKYQEVRW